jgi:hypothetical protein
MRCSTPSLRVRAWRTNRCRSSMQVEPVPLSEIARLPAPAGLRVAESFYWILRSPAPLAGMSYPPGNLAWSELQA